MKKHIAKSISLMLAMLFISFSFLSCENNGPTVSDSSSDGGLLGANPIENEKDGEEIITEEEKMQGEELLGGAGEVVTSYSGYLGYGYDVLHSAFFNHKDIKTSHPVVDMDTIAAKKLVYLNQQQSQHVNSRTIIANSTKQYCEEIASKANIKADFAFTGSFKASFEKDYKMEVKSNQKLITTQALLETQNEYILDVDADLLADYATKKFKDDVAKKTPKELFDTYGTHVLANISLGGRFDLNYFYTQTEKSESTDIEVSADASYRNVSGSASAKDNIDKKEIEENSRFYGKTYGGTVTVNTTSIEEAKKAYAGWSKSVEDGQVTFVNASEVVPLWEIVAALDDVQGAGQKSKDIQNYFNQEAANIAKDFKNVVDVTTYISEICIGYGNSKTSAKTMVRSQGVREENIIDLDLNKGAGGSWIYLGYKMTTDKSQAITNLVADYYGKKESSDRTENGIKYTILPIDLNKGARGKYIYLYYTKDPKAGSPLTMMQYQLNDEFELGNNKASGYEAVISFTDKIALDLNKDAGGDYIYLWFKRSK